MEERIMYRTLLLILVLLFTVCLAGCYDLKEVDQRAYVIAMGLDKSERENQLKITYIIANPEVGSLVGGSTDEPPQETITVHSSDFITAKNTANTVVSKQLTYEMLQIMVVSEELASRKDFIRWFYDTTKDREIRRDTYLAISKEDASEYLQNNKPQLETRPHKYFQFMITRGVETGMLPDSTFHRFYEITEQDADLFLAIYTTSKPAKDPPARHEDEYMAGEVNAKGDANKTQFAGAAVFKEGVMIGKLNGQETRIASVLDETTDIKDVLSTIHDPFNKEYRLAVRILKKQNNEVTMNLEKSTPEIRIKVPLVVDVLSDRSMVDYTKDTRKREILRRQIKVDFEREYNGLIAKSQQEFKGCPFPLSLDARKYFLTIKEYKNFDWMKTYPDMDIHVTVNIFFTGFGKQTKVPNIKHMRD
ncbi:Ger(x)C family spore germination protein [Peribacillus saganii]|uniref:Ger(X)C family spore germination protein n=1 Tax=Peribacillus saganii TaxID=2303992 RepID=A0A372LJ27_9BACI|nr:Ger(x)C family spore germination protein [Peribacillus saganii]RFU66395.1 Ger(x)C family spore germination protein [Peribacillus saganii]